MNITGNINLFEDCVHKDEKIYRFFHTCITKTLDNGGILSMNVDVYFKNSIIFDNYIPENDGKIMYCLNLKQAYLSVRQFRRKDGTEGRALVLVLVDYEVVKDTPAIDFNEWK